MNAFMLLRWAIVGLAVVSLSTAPIEAQSILDLPAGTRIRVDATGAPAHGIGTLVRTAPDTLWVNWAYRNDPRVVLASDVRKLEVSRGLAPRRIGRNAMRGFLIGAGIGAILGAVVANDPEDAEWFGGPVGTMGAYALIWAVPGTLVGGMTGIPRREIWEPVFIR